MRILHVVPSYVPAYRYGGPIRAVDGLARAQARAEHTVAVFTTDADGAGRLEVPLARPVDREGVEVLYFPLGVGHRLFRAPTMAATLCERIREFDLLHTHSVFLWPTAVAARAARAADVPYVVSPRGMLVRDLVRRRSRLVKLLWIHLVERRNLERAAALHLTSTIEETELKSFGIRPRQTFVIPNGLDLPTRSDLAVCPERERGRVVYVGRLSWKKGLDRLLQALQRVEGVRLTVAGPDDEGLRPRLEALAGDLGLGHRVDWRGAVDAGERDRLLGSAEVLVLPSLSENFGNVVVEAMAMGCPVLVTPEVGASELVIEAGAGIVTAGSPESLARALRDLLADPARIQALGEAGARFARERLTWDAAAAAMVEHYRMAIDGAPGEMLPT